MASLDAHVTSPLQLLPTDVRPSLCGFSSVPGIGVVSPDAASSPTPA